MKSKKFLTASVVSYLAVAGLIGTVVLAVKATPKAIDILEKAKEEKGEDLDKAEIVIKAAPVYLPTIILGGATIFCILAGDALNKRKQKALTSSYILVNNAYTQYKNKVKELYGEETHHKIMGGGHNN